MKLWPLISLTLFAATGALTAQESWARTKVLGDEALASGLWEVAELHYRNCLETPDLDSATKAEIAIRLAEALIRGDHPDAALELLDRSFVATHPAAPFWKGTALAGKHLFSEAIEIFGGLLESPAAPHRSEAGLTSASLLLALDRPDDALQTLARLLPLADPAARVKIQLYQVEILLDLGRAEQARASMPEPDLLTPAVQPLADFLSAELDLAEGNVEAAQAAFQEILNQSHGHSLAHYHASALGRADAIAALEDPQQATLSLLTFLQAESLKDHPQFPELEPMFQRILQWLPEKPEASDPVLEAFVRWIPAPGFPAVLPLDTSSAGVVAAWPVYTNPATPTAGLTAFSMYARAIGLHRIGSPETLAESKRLLERLRLEFPDHPMAERALYQTARWKLDAGDTDAAFNLLSVLRESSRAYGLRGEAAYLEARTAFIAGNPQQAIRLFAEAAAELDGDRARTAKLQQAIASLAASDFKGLEMIQHTAATADRELDADIQLERALATTPPAAARAELAKFLLQSPDHPRADEARIAAVEAALLEPEPSLDFARTQLAALGEEANSNSRLALARLRLADLTGDPAVAELARSVMDSFPGQPAAQSAALLLGRSLFNSGDYNAARMVLKDLATRDPDPARGQVAWLLAARAAAHGGTPQSNEEALEMFDRAIDSDGPLTAAATLERASHLIDMSRLAEASEFLGKWIKSLPENDPLQVPAGLLLGGALYAQGSSRPDSLVEALAVYDSLLARSKDDPALFNRLQFLRGITLELLPDPNNPSRKRETEAFEAYHSVLETTTAPAEWEYFESCGFHALALLERAKRWQAAISIARKIAAFHGPRAAEAADRANKIQLDQMIW